MSSVPRVLMRSRSALAGPLLVAAVCVVIWVLQVRHGGWGELARDGIVPLGLLVTVTLLWLWPVVVVDTGGLVVRNLARTHVIPWGAYAGVETRWGLKIRLENGKKISASACAASGGITRRDHAVPEVPEVYFYSEVPELRLSADSLTAGMLVERRSPRWQEEGPGPRVKTVNATAQGVEVRSTWNWAALAALAVALAVIVARFAAL